MTGSFPSFCLQEDPPWAFQLLRLAVNSLSCMFIVAGVTVGHTSPKSVFTVTAKANV